MFASCGNNVLDRIGRKYPGVARVCYIRIVTSICFIWMADSTKSEFKIKPSSDN